MFSRSRLIGSWRPVYIMNICLHCAKRWHRNPSDMWWTSTFKIGLRKIAILMCEQKVYPIRLHVNGRNDSHPNVVGPQCWGSLHPFAYACSLKFDLFQTLRNNSEKPATACKRVCKRTQSVTSNNVVSVCMHGAYGFRNLPSPFPGARAIRHSVHKNVRVYE